MYVLVVFFFFLMIRRPPRSTRTDTLPLHDALPISTPEEEAMRVAKRIRERIAGRTLVYGREEIPFTVSIGVAERDPGEANIDLLIKRADDAMYAEIGRAHV